MKKTLKETLTILGSVILSGTMIATGIANFLVGFKFLKKMYFDD